MREDTNLFAQQARNRRRSALIVFGFIAFFGWIGFGGDLAFYLITSARADPASYRHAVPWIGIVTVLLAAGIAWYAYRTSPRKVLWATRAREIFEATTPQERQLINVVEEMAIASGLPRPQIWIVPDSDPNAFATGIDPGRAHIAITEGLLAYLNRDELQGVVAHELAHVRNLDMRLMTLLATLVGAIALMSEGATHLLRGTWGIGGRGGGGGRAGGKKGGGHGALGLLLLVLWLVTLLIAPLVSRLLALAVSRKREFLADATAAQFTRNPAALASALQKIHDAVAPTTRIKGGTAHLCIADPLGRRVTNRQGFVADLLATHPPMAVRIARLKAMAYQQAKGVAV